MSNADLDPAVSDPPTVDELADGLARAVEIDDDTARSIVLALDGASTDREFERYRDSFNRQLCHRLKQAYLRRSE